MSRITTMPIEGIKARRVICPECRKWIKMADFGGIMRDKGVARCFHKDCIVKVLTIGGRR